MRHVSTKLLRVFVLLMEYRDLNAVAACTQGRVPTVAYGLARLREITGDPLFVKRNGTLEPTPQALRMEPTARQILAKWTTLMEPRIDTQAPITGHRVSIGFSPSIGEPVMAEILTALCERFPQNRFVTRTIVGDARLAASLDSGEIDCAFVVDSSFVPERVSWHNILVTPRRILSAAPGGKDGPTDASTDWILLQEDSEDGSPIRNFLSHRARARSHRETVVPSWQTQIALLQATGGTCAILDFNVTLVPRDDRMRVIAPPSSFPKSATLQFWTQARTSASQSLIEIRDIATTILQDPGKAINARAFPMIAHREYAAA